MKSPHRGANRDIGLHTHGSGKGDSPRNVGPQFRNNFESAVRQGGGWGTPYAKAIHKSGNRIKLTY